ncbi:replication initiation protein [Clostridium sporogenes]|uniref:replication initiation protein n=1 Tax=Clostridium TaxID=1485 RepID=UPI000E049A13|nr:replication initiation protein [Clostridium sporogenes]MCW6086517.1 replication initiation protein [Clostridium sporogenes]STE73776.1 Replication protein [Clostridium botulinum]
MDRNYIVKKSNYFIMNCNYDLSLEEQKIILTLASMVQPEDEDFKPYKFMISDFMKLINVNTKTKYIEIPKITKELMKKVFEINEGDTLIQTAWLSSATYKKGSGIVELEFSPKLKPYMLKLNSMFTQYKLENILTMKSKYSPRIYEILKCNEFKKQGYIELEIEDLRKLLKAENVYPLYANFKQKLLKSTQKELKEKTDISFEFEEIKTGRKVTALRFYIKSKKQNNIAKEEICATFEETNYIEQVKSIFHEEISSLQAKQIFDVSKRNIELIKEKYQIAKQTNNINNLVGWIIEALKRDYKEPIGKTKVDKFNDFEQRQYDFVDLERKLLGWNKTEESIELNEQKTKEFYYFNF